MKTTLLVMVATVACSFSNAPTIAQGWPALPEADGALEIPAQEWPQRPGPRKVRILVHYPQTTLASVTPQTGIMLTLHNWGGVDCVGTADPKQLAKRLNVVAICVNYLQSGRQDSIDAPEPYDFGYLQALDALRALWHVREQLKEHGFSYDDSRLYCTGGSGGGNVSLMANKLAPRTFAAIIDMCGMKKLSDDIAFNLPDGSSLNARWSRSSDSPNFLSTDDQELRFVGNPVHLAEMKRLGTESRIVVYHGTKDTTCPFEDAVEMVDRMRAAELQAEPHWIDDKEIDGQVFTSTGHALGNRTEIVITSTGDLLSPESPKCLRRKQPTDFDRREAIAYATTNGKYVIDFTSGFPVGRFEATQLTAETKSPEVLWKVDLASASYGSGSIADINGDGQKEIVFGTYFNDAHLYAVSARDGSVLWKWKSEGGPFDASVSIADLNKDAKPEILAADSSTGTLFCLNGSGELLWKFQLPNSTDSPPAVADLDGDQNMEIVVGTMSLGDGHGRVLCIDPQSLQKKWEVKIPGHIQSEPGLAEINGDGVLDVVVTTWRGDNRIRALDGKDGSELWGHEMKGDMYHGVTMFQNGGLRIVGTSIKGDVCLLDASGKALWTAHPGGYVFAPSSAADVNNDGIPEIIVASGRVHVFSVEGKELWQSDDFGSIGRGVAIADLDSDGFPELFFGARDRRFRALRGRTGEEVWSIDTTVKGHVFEFLDGAPLIDDFDQDGFLDVFFVAGKGTSDKSRAENYGRASAVRAGKGTGAWRTFRGNLLRTGVSE